MFGFYSGDRPVKEALKLMNSEGVSSLAVVDNQFNVVGNISNVDVKVIYSKFQLAEFGPNSSSFFLKKTKNKGGVWGFSR